MGGLSLCPGPKRILGVDFALEGSAALNWRARIAAVRTKIGLWKARRLTLSGRVLAMKVDILPSLVYLALVFPLPPELRLALVRDIFTFLWGGHEFVRRDWMHQQVAVGGRGVPDILTGGPL